MTPADWIIVAFALFAALAGWLQGFVVGAATLAGFGIGLVLGGRLGAALIDKGSASPYAPLFALVGALAGGLLLGGLLEAAGHGLRRRIRVPGLGVVDGLGGALLATAVALGLVWLAGAVALQTPGARTLRADIQRSAILRALNDLLPPSGPILNALARFDPVQEIAGPAVTVGPPDPAVARDADVRRAARSVVRVRGTACGLGIEGSGWIAAPGVVVTNAHVVAGQQDTTVEPRDGGGGYPAQAVAFDAHNDVAVLSVRGLPGAALPVASDPPAGTAGAVLGYPLDGPFRVRAARLGATMTAISQDAYGRGPVRRRITTFRGVVQPGNSGGPVVDGDGRVLTTVFAAARRRGRSGYGVPNAVVARAAQTASGPVSTGPCTG
ncbi:MAG TPA: MarP family serine protease [Solirubrobacteraceae bacterium]|nr:MarP family serine protease [Solirubrobacteraceae bacterium]HSD81318.1 MarP family serine protease [Solirubrobacteraceae bacterium]